MLNGKFFYFKGLIGFKGLIWIEMGVSIIMVEREREREGGWEIERERERGREWVFRN